MDNLTKEQETNLEKLELERLMDRGVSFQLGKRKYIIKEFYGGTLDALSEQFIKLEMVIPDGQETQAYNRYIKHNAKTWAKIIAIAALNSKWKIKFLSGLLAQKILWQYKPSDLSNLVDIVHTMCNYKDFIRSSVLIAGIRTTKPTTEEVKEQA